MSKQSLKTRLEIAKKKIQNKTNSTKNEKNSNFGEAFKLSTELVAAVAVGTIIGFILDEWFGTKPWLILIFFFDPRLKMIKTAKELITINKLALVNDKSISPIFISGPIL